MRWSTLWGREHNSGDTRIRERFLWWPKTIGTEVRWLERARWRERYTIPDYTNAGWDRWQADGWIDG